jgi:glycerol-3-phosphate dehydrogenase
MVPEVRAAATARPSERSGARGSRAAGGDDAQAHDVQAQPSADMAETIADEIARRTELLMVAQRGKADAREFQIDRMRTEFDLHEQERAELLREWNVTRDAAMEQMKHDDDIVKKWIALI